MSEKAAGTERTVPPDSNALIQALRRMPTPPPRAGFVDRALANASGVRFAPVRSAASVGRAMMRWETWFGAVMGGAVAAALTLILLRPVETGPRRSGITLALNEARDIDVLIEAERDLEDATIRIAVTGGVALNGLENEHIIDWRADLERGSNLLSLPVVARRAGAGQLVAVIEHDGKTRTVMIDLTVNDRGGSQS
jgi:hypothetical protein